MRNQNPRFTVIIPTRERPDVLRASLRTAVHQDYDNLEIIVSDNCSGDETETIVRSYSDPRIRYINTGRRLSMSDNWEFALSQVKDGWVVLLGDDDGLLPEAVTRIAELARASGAQAICSTGCSYVWPSATRKDHGRLYVSLQKGQEVRDSREWLRKLMRGEVSYSVLPMLYHGGFVDFEIIRRVKARCGRFYLSSIPDVYSAIAIASVARTYVFSHEPFAIIGQSRHSGGASLFIGELTADAITPAKKFASEPNIPFHPDVSPLPGSGLPHSLPAMVYESYLQSRMLREEPDQEITHEQQLRVILSSNGQNRDLVRNWSEAFGAMHGLDVERVARDARAVRVVRRLRHAPGLIWKTFNTISVGSREVPIADVYQASVLAETIRVCRPSRLQNNLAKLHRRLVLA